MKRRRRTLANHMVLRCMCSADLQLRGDRAHEGVLEALQSASLLRNLLDPVSVAPRQCLPGCHHSALGEIAEVLHQCHPLRLVLEKSVKAPSQYLLRAAPWHQRRSVWAPRAFAECTRWGRSIAHSFLAVIFDDAFTDQRPAFGHWQGFLFCFPSPHVQCALERNRSLDDQSIVFGLYSDSLS